MIPGCRHKGEAGQFAPEPSELAQFADHCTVSSQCGDQKLHLRPIPIDQNGIHIGTAPDQYRTYTGPTP